MIDNNSNYTSLQKYKIFNSNTVQYFIFFKFSHIFCVIGIHAYFSKISI